MQGPGHHAKCAGNRSTHSISLYPHELSPAILILVTSGLENSGLCGTIFFFLLLQAALRRHNEAFYTINYQSIAQIIQLHLSTAEKVHRNSRRNIGLDVVIVLMDLPFLCVSSF